MGHPRREFLPGVSMHIIRRGINRCAIVCDDEDRVKLLRIMRSAANEFDVAIHGYVLMTTHYHLIGTPPREDALADMLKAVGERYVRYFNERYDRVGTLWTGRPTMIPLMDERYWLTCLRYVEQNPWRAGMVSSPELYRWSSCRVHAFCEPSDWLALHDLYLRLGATTEARAEAYRAILGLSLTDEELHRQRHPTKRKAVSEVSEVPEVSEVSEVSGPALPLAART